MQQSNQLVSYPLESMTFEQAQQKQFRLVDCICRYFPDGQFLQLGDLGLVPGLNQPKTTQAVEKVIAEFFNAEAACLVIGSGTGALRVGLASLLKPNQRLLVHSAPIYPTTEVSIEQMGIVCCRADFNDLEALKRAIAIDKPDAVLVQHTRQTLQDSYDFGEVIEICKSSNLPVITDDNYAVMKVEKIGSEYGADLATFSSFKLLGPAGIGVVVGNSQYIESIRKTFYSGGSQVQGDVALEALRGMVFSPVLHAVQARVNDELLARLQSGVIPEVKSAVIANAQSKVLLVEFHEPIAEKVLENAAKLGALPYPVGAESRYEIPPLFYRVSGTFRANDPTITKRMIRINPNRSGADTVMRILSEAVRC